ncbi:MAG: hypothetical protein AMXMBFR64_33470 [Myxococcales bacterium]
MVDPRERARRFVEEVRGRHRDGSQHVAVAMAHLALVERDLDAERHKEGVQRTAAGTALDQGDAVAARLAAERAVVHRRRAAELAARAREHRARVADLERQLDALDAEARQAELEVAWADAREARAGAAFHLRESADGLGRVGEADWRGPLLEGVERLESQEEAWRDLDADPWAFPGESGGGDEADALLAELAGERGSLAADPLSAILDRAQRREK